MNRSFKEYKNFKDLQEGDYPNVCYKFRGFDDEDENLLRILTHREVFLSTRKEFDSDYPEGYLPFDYAAVTKDDIKRFTDLIIRKEYPYKSVSQRIALRDKMMKEDLKFYDPDNRKVVFDSWVSFLDQHYAFYCLSIGCKNVEMWEKRGFNFEGYCVEFDTRELILGLEINPVCGYLDYYEDNNIPIVKPISKTKNEAIEKSLKELFSVPKRYSYEDEYRIVTTSAQPIFKGKPLDKQNRAFTLPEKAFKSVIVGYEIGDSDLDQLKSAVSKELPDIRWKKAVYEEKQKKVIIEKFNPY